VLGLWHMEWYCAVSDFIGWPLARARRNKVWDILLKGG
jgi:hypothetical protein